ncbi:MAG: exonuclease domain-containing protein [bacterium]|nr:exonuclease domain-containing protein [bacterium]
MNQSLENTRDFRLIFLDTETTGNDIAKDRLCQICYKTSDGIHKGYFKPPIPVSVKAMSITNITNKMLEDKEAFKDSAIKKDLEMRLVDGILVAHNAKFDCAILEAEGMSIPRRICTFRLARHLDPENKIPEYNLSYLRYYLELEVADAYAHDAEGDVKVLHALFNRLLAKMTTDGLTAAPNGGEPRSEAEREEKAIAEMLDVSSRPSLFRLFNFGKYKDKKIEEVVKTDRGYLQWILDRKIEDGGQDEDWIHTLQYYLKN